MKKSIDEILQSKGTILQSFMAGFKIKGDI